jgi:peptide/nickel transport system substrate-binding protein
LWTTDRADHLLRPRTSRSCPASRTIPAAIQHRDLIGTNRSTTGSAPAPTASQLRGRRAGAAEKNPDHEYWGDAYLDEVSSSISVRIPAAWFAGAEADEFDMTYETVGEFVDLFAPSAGNSPKS